jgi:hypothetical protein
LKQAEAQERRAVMETLAIALLGGFAVAAKGELLAHWPTQNTVYLALAIDPNGKMNLKYDSR